MYMLNTYGNRYMSNCSIHILYFLYTLHIYILHVYHRHCMFYRRGYSHVLTRIFGGCCPCLAKTTLSRANSTQIETSRSGTINSVKRRSGSTKTINSTPSDENARTWSIRKKMGESQNSAVDSTSRGSVTSFSEISVKSLPI